MNGHDRNGHDRNAQGRKRRSRLAAMGAAVVAAGLSVASIATAGEDGDAPVPAKSPTAEDSARAQVLQQVARWAIANGYTGLSPVSLTPIDTPVD
jgi:hypothetical protein